MSDPALVRHVSQLRQECVEKDAEITRLCEALAELSEEAARLGKALMHYADERNWLNAREHRGVPGYHSNAVALRALEVPDDPA
jgi:hypothetical protein